jgi:diguanylate cyclase (GGDEF)-like protein/PAS domain S-box-containing protein
VFDGALDAVITMADDGRIMGWNMQAQTIFGWAKDEAMGMMLHELITPPQYRARHQQGMARFQATGESNILNRRIEITALRRSGEEYPIEMSILSFKSADHTRFTAFIADISERNRMQEKVRQLAYFDALTGLPNRRLLNDRLNHAMASSKRNGLYGALMFLDLDNFKPLNDTHGHVVGDLLLIEVAHRLSACVREMDTVARLGGDEFVVMLSELEADKAQATAQAGAVAEKIRATLAEPYHLTVVQSGEEEKSVEHRCSASIGLVMFIDHEASQADLLKWADAAMYQAKDTGRNKVSFYLNDPKR